MHNKHSHILTLTYYTNKLRYRTWVDYFLDAPVSVDVIDEIQTINIHFIHYWFLICLYVGLLVVSAVTCRDGGDGDAVAGVPMATVLGGAASASESASGGLMTRPSDARRDGGDGDDGALLLLPLQELLDLLKRGL